MLFLKEAYAHKFMSMTTVMALALYGKFANIGNELIIPKFLDTCQLIEDAGYICQKHHVVTEDGYILQLIHVVHPVTPSTGRPVLMMHGILAASDFWVTTGPDWDLPYLLIKRGYDVWLGDERGNYYSSANTHLSPLEPAFWNFTFYESGIYDQPAFVDFIISHTGYDKIFYIGHSLGTSVFLVMTSMRPEYNEKIQGSILLAPIATVTPVNEIPSPVYRFYVNNGPIAYDTLMAGGIFDFEPRTKAVMAYTQITCQEPSSQSACVQVIGDLYGNDPKNIDLEKVGFQYSVIPAGTSLKTVYSLIQLYESGVFQMFNYGLEGNLIAYNSTVPPLYPVSKITAPVALIYGNNDPFTNAQSTSILASLLPNLVQFKAVPDPFWNHMDYAFAINRREVFYPDVYKLLFELNRDTSSSLSLSSESVN